jgi:hypothetical protein
MIYKFYQFCKIKKVIKHLIIDNCGDVLMSGYQANVGIQYRLGLDGQDNQLAIPGIAPAGQPYDQIKVVEPTVVSEEEGTQLRLIPERLPLIDLLESN